MFFQRFGHKRKKACSIIILTKVNLLVAFPNANLLSNSNFSLFISVRRWVTDTWLFATGAVVGGFDGFGTSTG